MRHRSVTGEILYTSKKPELLDKKRGRETFNFTHHRDGSMIMRAHCEIEEPEPHVLRDIIYAVDPNGVPQHLHVHLTVDDTLMGSGWLRYDQKNDVVECESFGPSIGRVSQRMPTNGAFDGFGTHPVVADGFLTRCMDIGKGPHRRMVRVFLPSPDHRGATAPMVAEVSIGLEYVGEETKTVAAGTFDCRHFRYIDDVGPGMGGKTHPTYDMWVTADDDSILVYGSIDGSMMNRYELVALDR
ncbi:MAG: hypothetical protein AB8G17_11185 [Gammaproteobacteria bacterium]